MGKDSFDALICRKQFDKFLISSKAEKAMAQKLALPVNCVPKQTPSDFQTTSTFETDKILFLLQHFLTMKKGRLKTLNQDFQTTFLYPAQRMLV